MPDGPKTRLRLLPLSRWSSAELARQAQDEGVVASVSSSTVRRWLAEDAIKPWRYRSWIFPRDPAFADEAGRLLDLYQRRWHGVELGATSTTLVHLPVHASWLNQIKIVFSILQRKVIAPADFTDREALTRRITEFEPRFNATATPFD